MFTSQQPSAQAQSTEAKRKEALQQQQQQQQQAGSGVGTAESRRFQIVPVANPDAPTNPVADLLNKTTVLDVISTRDFLGKEVFCVHPEETVNNVISIMNRAKIRALPVLNKDNHPVGFIDQLDLAKFIVSHCPNADSVSEKDLTTLTTIVKKLDVAQVKDAMGLAHKDPLLTLHEKAPAFHAIDVMSKGVHRVVVFNDMKQVIAVMSQSDIVRWLATAIERGTPECSSKECKDMAEKPVRAFGFGVSAMFEAEKPPTVLHISPHARVLQGLTKLALTGASCLALVDDKSGRLVGNFSASDLGGCFRGSEQERAKELFLTPLSQYLKMHHPDSLNPLATENADIGFAEAVKLLASKRFHHLWSVDNGGRPVGIITLTDICKIIACEGKQKCKI